MASQSPHIVTIIGARPQFIKAATISHQLRRVGIRETLVHTGQHFDPQMSQIFFDELEIPEPAVNLHLSGLSHGALTGRMLEGIEAILLREKPQAVLVYGDTTSTLAGALAAAKLHIPVAHVEAGLQSFNRRMPEELNRILTDQVSEWLFVPTTTARENLKREGFQDARVRQVGDVMYDATLHFSAVAERKSDVLARLGLKSKTFVLATVHREENTDDQARLTCIIEALNALAAEETVLLPLHPRTRKRLQEFAIPTGKIRIIEPVGYLDMIELERHARLIATDSGGVQKEAYFLRTPCVTLRDETEWVELVEAGWNRLVSPTSRDAVFEALSEGPKHAGVADIADYGVGDAGSRIVDILKQSLGDPTSFSK